MLHVLVLGQIFDQSISFVKCKKRFNVSCVLSSAFIEIRRNYQVLVNRRESILHFETYH